MDGKAIEIVRDYIGEHLDKSDTKPDFEVYTVWKCKALQNWKYLLSSTLFDAKPPHARDFSRELGG